MRELVGENKELVGSLGQFCSVLQFLVQFGLLVLVLILGRGEPVYIVQINQTQFFQIDELAAVIMARRSSGKTRLKRLSWIALIISRGA